MYQLAFTTSTISSKFLYAIRKGCTIEGEKYPVSSRMHSLKYVIPPAKPVIVDWFPALDLARGALEKTEDEVIYIASDNTYRMKEWFLRDEDGQVIQTSDRLRLITEHSNYSPQEVKAMQTILISMNDFHRLATLIAFEKFGFLTQAKEESGKILIRYEDVRKTATCNVETLEVTIEPKILKNKKESEEEK